MTAYDRERHLEETVRLRDHHAHRGKLRQNNGEEIAMRGFSLFRVNASNSGGKPPILTF